MSTTDYTPSRLGKIANEFSEQLEIQTIGIGA